MSWANSPEQRVIDDTKLGIYDTEFAIFCDASTAPTQGSKNWFLVLGYSATPGEQNCLSMSWAKRPEKRVTV